MFLFMTRHEREKLQRIFDGILWELREVRRELHELHHRHHHYTVRIEGDMAITAGSTGSFTATLLGNGAPVTGFVPSFSWTADDTNAALQPSDDTLSCVVTVPATDTTTTLNLTATTTAPDGTIATGSVAVTITPSATPTVFTVQITETA